MKDTIYRADAIEAMEARIKWFNGDAIEDRCKRDAFIQALDIITELPSAEAVQGEWIRSEGGIKDWEGTTVGYSYWYECDQCGSRPPKDTWGHEWHSNFCPNCGAKMTKGGEQNDD